VARWIDISTPLATGMPRYPGDPEVLIERSVENGCSLTTLSMSVHTGTHMDAPLHFLAGGASIDEIPMEVGIGPARVIELGSALPEIQTGERILCKTKSAFTEAQARLFAARGTLLAGIDSLSVDPLDSATLPAHHILLHAGVWIVEGLDLSQVEPGEYDLICLPLRIAGADGAPARALLRAR
jgi:arylformamidase